MRDELITAMSHAQEMDDPRAIAEVVRADALDRLATVLAEVAQPFAPLLELMPDLVPLLRAELVDDDDAKARIRSTLQRYGVTDYPAGLAGELLNAMRT